MFAREECFRLKEAERSIKFRNNIESDIHHQAGVVQWAGSKSIYFQRANTLILKR